MDGSQKIGEDELVITRLLDASPERAFEVFSKPEHILKWWGPKGFTAQTAEIDFRVGGRYRISMYPTHKDDCEQRDYVATGVYEDITAPSRLVFTFAWEEQGDRGVPNRITVTFEPDGDKTRFTFRHGPFLTAAERDSHIGGWSSIFDKFKAYFE